jgi:hypothetical protein
VMLLESAQTRSPSVHISPAQETRFTLPSDVVHFAMEYVMHGVAVETVQQNTVQERECAELHCRGSTPHLPACIYIACHLKHKPIQCLLQAYSTKRHTFPPAALGPSCCCCMAVLIAAAAALQVAAPMARQESAMAAHCSGDACSSTHGMLDDQHCGNMSGISCMQRSCHSQLHLVPG